MLGELRFAQPLQAVVELLDRPTLPAQRGVLPGDVLEEMAEAALAQPLQDGLALGEEREVAYVVALFAQQPDGLVEVAEVGDRHGRDHDSVVLGQSEVEHLDHALPPGRQVLEVPAQFGRQHAAQTEAGVLGIADDTAGQPPLELVRRLRLSPAERAVDPQKHAQTLVAADYAPVTHSAARPPDGGRPCPRTVVSPVPRSRPRPAPDPSRTRGRRPGRGRAGPAS